jgi:hypothetical protein
MSEETPNVQDIPDAVPAVVPAEQQVNPELTQSSEEDLGKNVEIKASENEAGHENPVLEKVSEIPNESLQDVQAIADQEMSALSEAVSDPKVVQDQVPTAQDTAQDDQGTPMAEDAAVQDNSAEDHKIATSNLPAVSSPDTAQAGIQDSINTPQDDQEAPIPDESPDNSAPDHKELTISEGASIKPSSPDTAQAGIQDSSESNSSQTIKTFPTFVTQIMDRDLSALDEKPSEAEEDSDEEVVKQKVEMKDSGSDAGEPMIMDSEPKLKLASFADFGGTNCQSETPHRVFCCGHCTKEVASIVNQKESLVWEMILFCDDICLRKYQSCLNTCTNCNGQVDSASIGKYCERFDSKLKHFCSPKCLEDQNANTAKTGQICLFCSKLGEGFLAPIGEKGQFKNFCVQSCLDKYLSMIGQTSPEQQETIITPCAVCSEEKPVGAELVLSDEKVIQLCSNPCLSAFKYAQTCATSKCNLCRKNYVISSENKSASVHSGQMRLFCSEKCGEFYRVENGVSVKCGWCKYSKPDISMISKFNKNDDKKSSDFYFCSTNCLYMHKLSNSQQQQNGEIVKKEPKNVAIVEEKKKKKIQMRNKGTLTKPHMSTKGVSCRPHPCHASTQTDAPRQPTLVPIPVPIMMPVPMQMYQRPYPVPIPIPLPIPVPIFIPTTRNSTRGIKKFMKKVKAKLPSNVFEAQILEMAGALTGKENDPMDSDDSEWEDYDEYDQGTKTITSRYI